MQEEKCCNCRNSKCMKLYCECFAARVSCGKNCHCVDCHNLPLSKSNPTFVQAIAERDKRLPQEELIRVHKGCACRKSYCTKKYCECFQAGILCKDTCKCVDCQNNESLANKRVILQLKRNNSEANSENSMNLYPLYLSQNAEHLSSIISECNTFGVNQNWLQGCAEDLCNEAKKDTGAVMVKLIDILKDLQQRINKQELSQKPQEKQQRLKFQAQEHQEQINKHAELRTKNIIIPKANLSVSQRSGNQISKINKQEGEDNCQIHPGQAEIPESQQQQYDDGEDERSKMEEQIIKEEDDCEERQ